MLLGDAVERLFDRIVDPSLLVRRMYVVANHTVLESKLERTPKSEQLSLFENVAKVQKQRDKEADALAREKNIQHTVLGLQQRFGKNAVLKGFNLKDGATSVERNGQIGGHRA